ncbi:hypothetical protein [Rhizobium azibense]|uniref:hypothetical protein n=1 Tax=Rhizobium azibense TaxID=1136135 RepID=UPI0014043860|nr:hypothetical protein [Rhizobium azibense]
MSAVPSGRKKAAGHACLGAGAGHYTRPMLQEFSNRFCASALIPKRFIDLVRTWVVIHCRNTLAKGLKLPKHLECALVRADEQQSAIHSR